VRGEERQAISQLVDYSGRAMLCGQAERPIFWVSLKQMGIVTLSAEKPRNIFTSKAQRRWADLEKEDQDLNVQGYQGI